MPVYEHIEDYPMTPRYEFSPFMTKEELEHRNALKIRFNKELGTDFAPIGDYCIVTDEQYAEIRKLEDETQKRGIKAYKELQDWLHCGDYSKFQEWLKSKRNNDNDTNKLS